MRKKQKHVLASSLSHINYNIGKKSETENIKEKKRHAHIHASASITILVKALSNIILSEKYDKEKKQDRDKKRERGEKRRRRRKSNDTLGNLMSLF